MFFWYKITKNRFFARKNNMEDQYTRKEQEAIVSVLCALMQADFRDHDGEHQALQEALQEIGFDDADFQPYPKAELESKAYETLRHMSKEKKRAFSLMMTKTARSDGHFGPRERAFVIEILEMCDIPFVHK